MRGNSSAKDWGGADEATRGTASTITAQRTQIEPRAIRRQAEVIDEIDLIWRQFEAVLVPAAYASL
jgi:hypothetical protein